MIFFSAYIIWYLIFIALPRKGELSVSSKEQYLGGLNSKAIK